MSTSLLLNEIQFSMSAEQPHSIFIMEEDRGIFFNYPTKTRTKLPTSKFISDNIAAIIMLALDCFYTVDYNENIYEWRPKIRHREKLQSLESNTTLSAAQRV